MMVQVIDFANAFGVAQVQGDQRKAALLLHALPASDRAWLLSRLPAPDQDLLGQLLAELKEFDIPVTPDVLDEVLSSASAQSKPLPERPQAASGAETGLERADPCTLARILDDEPVGLIVRLLHLRAWPWQSALLAALREGKRHQVEARLAKERENTVGLPPLAGALTRVDRQLIDLLKDRLADPPVARNAPAKRDWRERWLRLGRPAPRARVSA